MPVPTTRDECHEACERHGIPIHMWEGMANYFIDHTEVGGFLRLVIQNNYYDAAGKADDQNQHCLLAYIRYIYNAAPPGSHGSPEAYDVWTDPDKSCE